MMHASIENVYRAANEHDVSRGILIIVTLFLVSGALEATTQATAQETHVERLQLAGIQCLGELPKDLDRFYLDPSDRAPYIRSALVEYWMKQNKIIYRDGSEPDKSDVRDSEGKDSNLPSLQYDVDEIGIDLGKPKSGRLQRIAFLGIQFQLTGPDSQILADSHCDISISDTLSVDMAKLLQDTRFPETDVQPSEKNWINRVLQPAVLIGAAAVGTFLLFNLRSTQSEGG